MTSLGELVSHYARSVQPLVFETGLNECPYSTAGTVFLVGYGGKPFVLTTRHGLRPDTPYPICVFPSDSSRRLIPLDDVFFVSHSNEPDDYMDLAVIAINTSLINDAEVAAAPLVALCSDLVGWPEDAGELVVIGYPSDHAFVDPEDELIHTHRVVLNGRYAGRSSMPYVHKAVITDVHDLSTFSGLSGSPVFAVLKPPGQPPSAGLCGMAVRGSSSSNIIHFLDRAVLIDALKVRLGRNSAT